MKNYGGYVFIFLAFCLHGCGTLDGKTVLIDAGDTKKEVLKLMGPPQDRQFEQAQEAWQYCVSGAGFGYNDHKIIWFNEGLVTGITSYKTTRSGCTGAFKTIRWEEAPDFSIETRER
jgi:hypothetical protein